MDVIFGVENGITYHMLVSDEVVFLLERRVVLVLVLGLWCQWPGLGMGNVIGRLRVQHNRQARLPIRAEARFNYEPWRVEDGRQDNPDSRTEILFGMRRKLGEKTVI